MVEHVAVREEERVTAEHPVMVVPFAVKATVPVGLGDPEGLTVAVKVTVSPRVEGLAEEVRAVVVTVRGGADTLRMTKLFASTM